MKKPTSSTAQTRDAQAPDWPFWLWLAAAMSVVLIAVVIVTAWSVRHAFAGGNRLSDSQVRFVMEVSKFPSNVYTAILQVRSLIENEPLAFLRDRKRTEQPQWIRRFPAPEDSGYLLLPNVDSVSKRFVVELIRISDGKQVSRWTPDWEAIINKNLANKFTTMLNLSTVGPVHPLLLADGDIIFNTTSVSALVRQGPCSSKPIWMLDDEVSHSIELDETEGAVWVPSVSHDGFPENTWLQERIKDDALAHVSIDGRLLEKRSFSRILRDNGLQALLLGISSQKEDLIHLNQIKVARQSSPYWQRGDLLISARRLSTVFLYRPSTNKIVWHQTGPWMNQHSVDFVDDHRISVYDNNIIINLPAAHSFLVPGDTNHVLVYDFGTKQISQPYSTLLAEARPVTITGGRARVLPDGGLFIEETERGRHLRFTKDRLLWSRVNDYDDQHIAISNWARYLTAEEASIPIKALAARHCTAEN